MLGIGQGDAQLALRLNEAHLLVDPLIAEGIHYGKHAALTSVGSHYGGIDFDAVGRGYMSGKSDSDVLAIGSAAAHGAKALASKLLAAYICHQY